MMFAALLFVVGCGVVSLTGVVRRYAVTRDLIDVPTERSSHSEATPRGGGLAIAFCFLAASAMMLASDPAAAPVVVALLGAGAPVAVVGLLDDHGAIGVRWRLLVHFAASAFALWWLGGLPPIPVFGRMVELGLAGDVLAVVGLVWLLNLYNFMDGIDGIASVETVTTCLGGLALAWTRPADSGEWQFGAVLLVATLGFLPWNFPKARVFLGDVGSGFLGVSLGVLWIRGSHVDADWFWSWAILLGVFVVDSTFTLLRRLIRRERVYVAHRSHAYQHAAMRCRAHVPITLGVVAINLFWLLPLALAVGLRLLDGLTGLAVAYLPLVALAWKLNAGVTFKRAS